MSRPSPSAQDLPLLLSRREWLVGGVAVGTALACGGLPVLRAGQLNVVERTSMGKLPADTTTMRFALLGTACAWLELENGGWWLWYEGAKLAGPFAVVSTGGLGLSLDGRSWSIGARGDAGWFAVVDGKAGKSYAEIKPAVVQHSPDGRRHGYLGLSAEGWRAVVDGVETEPYLDFGTVCFTSEGRWFAAFQDATGQGLMVEGREVEGRWLMTQPFFPAFGCKGMGAKVVTAEGAFVWRDGAVISGPWVDVLDAQVLPDGRTLDVVQSVEGWWVLLGEARYGPYVSLTVPNLSLGGQTAWASYDNVKWQVFREGVPVGEALDELQLGAPRFSRDGAHVVHWGRLGDKIFVWVDGQVVGGSWLTLGADGAWHNGGHTTFLGGATMGQTGPWTVVLDDKPLGTWASINGLVLSDDGRWLTFITQEPDARWVQHLVDTTTRVVTDDIVVDSHFIGAGGFPRFEGGKLVYHTLEQGKVYRLKVALG